MLYDDTIQESTLTEALGVTPTDPDGHGVTTIFERATAESALRLTLRPYDDEALIELTLSSGRNATRIECRKIQNLRVGQDPQSRFLELGTSDTTITIWFYPEPRIHVLSPG